MPPTIEKVDIETHNPSGEFRNYDPNAKPDLQSPASHDSRQNWQSSPKPGATHIPFLDRLRQLPEVRAIPWRTGQELPLEKSLESPRVQQRGATLLSTRGEVAPVPCTHCASGNGRFSLCITMDQWFQGGCSGCIFTSKGNHCSLRTQSKSGVVDGRKLRYQMENPDAAVDPKPSKKRKRQSAPPKTLPGLSTFPNSPDMDSVLQSEIAREQPTGLHSLHDEKQQHRHSYPSQPNVARARGPVIPQAPNSNEAHSFITDLSSNRDTVPLLTDRILPVQQALEGNTYGTPASGPVQDFSGYRSTMSPIINTLPKAKQRQIYSAVSGLQGGIDHLQKQLNAVKGLLGIAIEDLDEPR